MLLKYHIKERCEIAFVGMANTSRINPATMPTKRVPPPPQGVVAPPRKSTRRRTTKEKSNDSDDDDEDPLLLKSPPEPLATMPTLAGDDYDDYNECGEDDCSPVVKSNPNGLLYSSDDDDDDDDTFKFDADLEDFTLKDYADSNKEAKLPGKRRLRYDDGPQPRDYSKMTPTERLIAEAEDTKKRRVWLAKQRRERMLNESAHIVNFTGIVHASIRTMHDVEQGTRLQLGQTFPSSNIIMLRCAEEANLRGIYVTTLKSDKFTFKSEGLHFRVHASNSEVRGWKITLCETSVGAAGTDTAGSSTRSPYSVKMVVPLIYSTIAELPMASNKMLLAILSEYGKPYVMTDNIIQKARIMARKEMVPIMLCVFRRYLFVAHISVHALVVLISVMLFLVSTWLWWQQVLV